MNKFRAHFVAALGLLGASSAFAADMPVKALTPAQTISARWDGWYVGFQVGERWGKNDMTTNCIQGSSSDPFECGGTANPFAVDSSGRQGFSNSGLRTGIYFGANTQVNNWVFGLESDWAYFKHSTSVPGLVGCQSFVCNAALSDGFSLSGDSTSIENKWDASLRARIGFVVMPSVMFYGTGGIAWQRVSATMSCSFATSPGCTLFNMTSTDKQTLVGYTVGAGLEWMMTPNLILRGEYRYSDFGNMHASFFVGSGDIEIYSKIRVSTQMATLGIAYKMDFAR